MCNKDQMVSLFEDHKGLIPDQRCLTCRKTLSLSSGAVPVLDTDPATAPAISCRHTNPDCFSFSENSSGTVRCSPMSNIYTNTSTNTQQWSYRKKEAYFIVIKLSLFNCMLCFVPLSVSSTGRSPPCCAEG